MRHLRCQRYLRENVTYFTWCTTLFLSRFAIFCKKRYRTKMWLQYFSVSWKKHAVPAVWYMPRFRYLMAGWGYNEKIYRFPSFSRNKKSRTKVTKRGNLFIQTHKSTNWNRQGGHKAEIQVFDDQRTSFLLFMNWCFPTFPAACQGDASDISSLFVFRSAAQMSEEGYRSRLSFILILRIVVKISSAKGLQERCPMMVRSRIAQGKIIIFSVFSAQMYRQIHVLWYLE